MPKIAFSRRRSAAIVRSSVHVVPLLSAVLLISVNLATWYPRRAPSTPALQFIAKAIELFTQASIAHLVLFHIRHKALGQRAIPFGSLFAGLQTTNISYLWSLEFIGTLSANWCSLIRRFTFALFLGFNVILAASVGPSIAIALIPRKQPFPFGTVSVWFQGSEDDLFPLHLNKSHVPSSCFATSGASSGTAAYLECPWRALPTVLEMVKTKSAVELPGVNGQMNYGDIRQIMITDEDMGDVSTFIPLTLGPNKKDSPFLLFLNELWRQDRVVVTATTKGLVQAYLATSMQIPDGPQSPIREFTEVDSFSRLITTRSKQALAWTQCEETLNPYDTKNIKFPEVQNRSLVDIPDIEPSLHWRLVWADVDPKELPISIAAIVVPPSSLLETTSSTKDGTSRTPSSYNAFVCTIAASWADDVMVIIDGNQLRAESNITAWPKTAVTISSEWANLLLSNWPSANDPNTTLLDTIMPPALEERYANLTTQDVLSGLIVAAMSQTLTTAWNIIGNPDNSTTLQKIYSSDANPTEIQNGTAQNPWGVSPKNAYRGFRLDADLTSVGLAYSARGVPTIIALVVLFTYSLYVFLSIIYILAICPESSSAWDSISELTSLAILSTPTDRLRNTSAGIETISSFQEPINIRATKDNKLEIVFEKDGRDMAVEAPQADKAY